MAPAGARVPTMAGLNFWVTKAPESPTLLQSPDASEENVGYLVKVAHLHKGRW
jgi:hypothetical protein